MIWPLMSDTITEEDRNTLIDFIRSTKRFTSSVNVKKMELLWSEWLGCKYSIFVSSGSTANLLLISAIKEKYNLKNGDKVLVPACTWSTTISPIMQLGLEPVFCDINLYDYSFDVEKFEQIKKENEIKVVFVTHLLGIPADIKEYKKHFPEAIFIEDSCECTGGTIDGVKTGNFSEGATFSFYFGHHMTCIEGGMVSTNDKEIADIMKLKRSHGLARELSEEDFEEESKKYPEINKKFLFITDGFNFRNTEIGAVLAISQLKKIDENNKIRIKNYQFFLDIIKQYEEEIYIPKQEGNCSFCFPFVFKNKEIKNNLEEIFNKNGIETRPIVGGNLLRQPFLSKYKKYICPNADILNNNGFYIGNNHFVNEEKIEILRTILINYFEENK